jgi:hypothetical protein
LCNETPKLPRCHYQNTMELTKYDNVTTNHVHKILLNLKPKLGNVETNPSKWFFLFIPNLKIVGLVQCQFLFAL